MRSARSASAVLNRTISGAATAPGLSVQPTVLPPVPAQPAATTATSSRLGSVARRGPVIRTLLEKSRCPSLRASTLAARLPHAVGALRRQELPDGESAG